MKPKTISALEAIQKVVFVSSDSGEACRVCGSHESLGLDVDIGEKINHYIGHGYKLLHVGAETKPENKGQLWYRTVAILGI
jgi:hypothetical protein